MGVDVRLEIRHLRLLAAVAEEGSVTGAGRRLHLTQSALSHQLRDAEEKMGVSLFLRLGKKMIPTPAGEQLIGSARRVLKELSDAETLVEGLNGGARGVIRLSTECYTCYHWLPSLLKKFHDKYPQVDLCIDAEATSDPGVALLAGRLDVAIMHCPPRNRSVRSMPMFEDEMVVVMSPEHRLARLTNVRPKDMADETAIIYPPRSDSTLINKVLTPAGVEPKRVLEVPLTEAILEMVAAGTGIGFLARWAVAPEVQRGRIVARPLSTHGFRRQWHAVTLRSQPLSPCLKDFIDLLTSHVPKQVRRAES